MFQPTASPQTTPEPPASMDPKIGQIINNKYRLVRLIGDGGMGSVFEAEHELLGTTVALKFLHTALSRRKGLVDRFLQEAQVSARIKSAHVVRVSDVDRTPDGLAYMVMEYVEGKTLQTLYEDLYVAGKRLSYGDAFAIMLQLLDGVTAAHKRGIVHRDLKPDNVMISRDSKGRMLVKILDFGIAKLKASGEMDRGLTRPGVVMGTPEYMAPEQAFSADKVDARADIFSLGVMFFEMLAGRRPVGGDNAHAIAAQYLEGKISRLRDLKPAIAHDLAEAVHTAMAADPKERFGDLASFRKAIEMFSPSGPGDGITQPSTDLGLVLDTDEDVIGEDSVSSGGVASGAASGDAASGDRASGDRASGDRVSSGSVPKTVPPEQTFSGAALAVAAGPSGSSAAISGERLSDSAISSNAEPLSDEDESEPPDSSDLQTRVARAVTSADVEDLPQARAVDPLAATADGESAAHAATDAMPLVDEMAIAARAGTEAMPAGAAPLPRGAAPLAASGTQVGADEAALPAGARVRPLGGAMNVPPRLTPARGRKRGGPSIFTVLLIAASVAGAVVGGVYLAHQASEHQDSGDDPPVLQLQPKPTKPKPTAKPGPEPRPTVVPPPLTHPTPVPPRPYPPSPTPPGPTPPSPTPTPTVPTFPTVPTGFPTMLPSSLPFPTGFPPFPGQRPPSPQPQPGPSPAPAGPKPAPTIPKLKFPLPNP